MLRVLRFLLLAATAGSIPAQAIQKQFTGSGDGSGWHDGTNWFESGVPSIGDSVVINKADISALTDEDFEDISHGRNLEAEVQPNTIGWFDELPVAILVPASDGTAHARKVF